MVLDKRWKKCIDGIDYAFQPIVNAYSGQIYAVEALMRNVSNVGFASIDALFDAAYNQKVLFDLELALRRKVLEKFLQIPFYKEIKIFYNLDNRTPLMPNFQSGKTTDILHAFGLPKETICFELSEKHQQMVFASFDQLTLNIYKQHGYRMAIDDFGVGYSGLQALYNAEPDFIKIDRFFIDGIAKSAKKRLFLQNILEISQSLGIGVIAEGVETKEDFLACRNLGCTMIQGYFVAKPTKKVAKLMRKYDEIELLFVQEKRNNQKKSNIKSRIEPLAYVKENESLKTIQRLFRSDIKARLVPVLGEDKMPLGVIKEEDLKAYIYSPYGWSLLYNQTKGSIKELTSSCGIVDVNDSLEKILKIYANSAENEGVIVVENGVYLGFLNAKVLLEIINEKNLLNAKDQNPLTGLMGNRAINAYINEILLTPAKWALVYFDMDNFKPFNDYYGFRSGDRVIKLFADILKKASNRLKSEVFIGHIGGDDFFLGWKMEQDFNRAYCEMKKIIKKFRSDVESFYSNKEREDGYILAKDRYGQVRKYPILSVSAAMLVVNTDKEHMHDEEVVAKTYARLKKQAKIHKDGFVAAASLI
jgi:diguanylate cyclase (GGDEF)-like protein